jgi:alpha-glucosidase
MGLRQDGSVHNELLLRVYASLEASSFTLYEDDGETIAYQHGEVRTTLISQLQSGSQVTVTIAAAEGDYTGAVQSRSNVVYLVTNGLGNAKSVLLNGSPLAELQNSSEFEANVPGWLNAGENLMLIITGPLGVSEEKVVTCEFGE